VTLRQLTGWRPSSVASLVRRGLIHATLPGTGFAVHAGDWLPGPERRALRALRHLHDLGGLSPEGNQFPSHSAKVAVARAARSHEPGTLVDTATNEAVDDAEAWVRDWRASGGTVALLVRVSEG
jgi:hypothetical protein